MCAVLIVSLGGGGGSEKGGEGRICSHCAVER